VKRTKRQQGWAVMLDGCAEKLAVSRLPKPRISIRRPFTRLEVMASRIVLPSD
jgi:hypothetical protein